MRERGFRLAGVIALAGMIALSGDAFAQSRHAVPSHSGGGHAGSAPSHGTAMRAPVPSHGHASGTAHYGYGGYYGHGGYYGGYYPYYPWWGYYGGYPGWSIGWSWGWGWPYAYGYYGAPAYYYDGYGPYDDGPGGYPAPSGPAVVETDVLPKKAEVVVDGEVVGNAKDFNGTWDELRLDPGRHTLEFRHEGYRSLIIDLDARPGGHYSFRDNLVAGSGEEKRTVGAPPHPAPAAAAAGTTDAQPEAMPAPRVASGLLRVHAVPDDAGVYLDGQFLGLARELASLHGALPVATGEHRLEVVRPGYASVTKMVSVSGEGTAEVSIALEPQH